MEQGESSNTLAPPQIKTNYSRCIICQIKQRNTKVLKLQNITEAGFVSLKEAMENRGDDVASRLNLDMCEDFCVKYCPKWHAACRTRYTKEKLYLAAKKRRDKSGSQRNRPCTRQTRKIQPFKKVCVICNKVYDKKGVKANCMVQAHNRGISMIKKAQSLCDYDMLEKIQGGLGKPIDMIANDVCYHRQCMNNYLTKREKKSSRPSTGKAGSSIREHAKTKLTKASNKKKVKHEKAIKYVARLIRKDALKAKKKVSGNSLEISREAASKLIPESMLQFSQTLLMGKKKARRSRKSTQKVVDFAQQMLFTTTKQPTPLALGTAFHLYNETRSKKLLTTFNRLNQSVSYTTFQRYLTGMCENIIDVEQKEGIYIPPNLSTCDFAHFAIDNIDWHENTPDGKTFHGMSIIAFGYKDVSQPQSTNDNDLMPVDPDVMSEAQEVPDVQNGTFGSIPLIPSTSRHSRRSISNLGIKNSINPCYLSLADRRKARSLQGINPTELFSADSGYIGDLRSTWRMCRMFPTKLLEADVDDTMSMFPGWFTFFSLTSCFQSATDISYLPIIPEPPNADVVMAGLRYLSQLTSKMNMKYTICTADQAIYDIAYGLRERDSLAGRNGDVFDNMILMMGAFHIEKNFLGAVGKFMRRSGAEEILVKADVCQKGTANKVFGPSPDYYQAVRSHEILNEAMSRVYYDSFEDWCVMEGLDTLHGDLFERLSSNIQCCRKHIHENTANQTSFKDTMKSVVSDLNKIQQLTCAFDMASASPTFQYWRSYVKMTDLLTRLSASIHDGLWNDYLSALGDILPYLVAARHFNYSYSLPLYIREMKKLADTAPEVYKQFTDGKFVVRRSNGQGNAVSPDLALEQTYNKDVKEKSGLSGITLNDAARNKWIYTKPALSACSSKYKDMIGMSSTTSSHHHKHEGKASKVQEAVKVIGSEVINPFQHNSQELVNIVTGEKASKEAQRDLTSLEKIGMDAISKSLSKNEKKIDSKMISTFQERKKGSGQGGKIAKGSAEISVLKRLLKMSVVGESIDVSSFIGNYECAPFPPSLFEADSNGTITMRHGSKSSWVTSILKETGVAKLKKLPETDQKTALVIDSMCFIRKYPFSDGETFQMYESRCFTKVMSTLPPGCKIVHFPADRYDFQRSRKRSERIRRTKGVVKKEFKIEAHLQTPSFKEFTAMGSNKAALQAFLSKSWCSDESKQRLGDVKLYLSGGFEDVKESVCVSHNQVDPVPALSCLHEEADTRVFLHAAHSIENHQVKRVVIFASDTDILVMGVYYSSKWPGIEIFIQRQDDEFIPIHNIAENLGAEDCKLQPIIHAISGMDDVSYIRNIGKKSILTARKAVACNLLSNFGEPGTSYEITDQLLTQARELVLKAAGGGSFDTLADFRTLQLLKSASRDIQRLVPKEDSFCLHMQRAMLSALVMKNATNQQPQLPEPDQMGWKWNEDHLLEAITSTQPQYPDNAASISSCGCTTSKCKGRCKCKAAGIPCTKFCKCRAKEDLCCRVQEAMDVEETDDDGTDSEANDPDDDESDSDESDSDESDSDESDSNESDSDESDSCESDSDESDSDAADTDDDDED